MNPLEVWPFILSIVALAIPSTLALAALTAPRRAELASGVALGLALIVAVLRGTSGDVVRFGVRIDVVTCVMLVLVAALGVVIVRFSRTYLHGDGGLSRYHRWLLLTLSSVTALIVANNLLVIALAWTATSVVLHQLLTFYENRTAALVAAHKKFLVSRVADACLVACLAIVSRTVGSLDLDRIAAWASTQSELPVSMQVAAVLVVVAVALKSAQLPFHGWLTQVMEAPTPVSALLHAGVVNIGGFVLIRLAPWMAHAKVAQMLLVCVGLVTAVVAALVMTTRVSVKVSLAWSTCAQMGFMLVQCGLGLWHLALLHLVAHSLYKAHAFLSSGTTVEDWRLQALANRAPSPTWTRLALGVLVAVGCVTLGVVALQQLGGWAPGEGSIPLFALVVSLSIVPLLARPPSGLFATATAALRASGVVLLSVAWHASVTHLMPLPAGSTSTLAWALVGFGYVVLFAVKATVQVRPQGQLARRLYPWLFAGLYLDERFTRFTFRVWPPRLTPRPTSLSTSAPNAPLEVA